MTIFRVPFSLEAGAAMAARLVRLVFCTARDATVKAASPFSHFVRFDVVGDCKNLQVLWPVIGFHAVAMMDNFARPQRPAKQFLHDLPVNGSPCPLAGHAPKPVAVRKIRGTFIRKVPNARPIRVSALQITKARIVACTQSRWPNKECAAAIIACVLKLWHAETYSDEMALLQ